MTNDRKHRKEYPVGDSWQRRGDSVGEPLFYGRSLEVAGKKLGICTCSADGVKGGDMRGRNHELNSGESLLRPTVGVGKRRYKPTGESLGEAEQEVGWVNYYRISNCRAALKGLVWYACKQLRIHLRRRFSRKNSQYSKRWPDNLFHDHYELLRVSDLLQTGS